MAFKVFERNEAAIAKAVAKYSNTEKKAPPTYRFKEGKTTIRVMGPWDDQGVWYREFREHQVKIGKTWIYTTCARPFGKRCILCERCTDIYKLGGEENIKVASNYKAKKQFLMNIVVLADPDGDQRAKGIVPVKTGISVLRPLLNFDAQPVGDEGFGDITNLIHGFNVSVELSSDKKYTVMPSRARTNIQDLLNRDGFDLNQMSMVNLDELLPPLEMEELAAIIESAESAPGMVEEPVKVVETPVAASVTVSRIMPPGMTEKPNFDE